MKQGLRQFPYHVFIAALLPILTIVLQNFYVIRLQYLVMPFVYIISIAIISYFIGYFVTRVKGSAFLFTTFVLASGFYFYTGIQKILNLFGSKYVRDIYCFSLWAIMVVLVLLLIKKKLSVPGAERISSYLNKFAGILLLVGLVFGIFSLRKMHQKYDPAKDSAEIKLINNTAIPAQKLNVYYLLMDECANETTVKKLLSYDSPFDEELKMRNFFVAKNAVSSFSETFNSMSSTLNLVPLKPAATYNDHYINNAVNYFYKKMGYQTEMMTSFFVKNNGNYKSDVLYDPYGTDLFENEFVASILTNTAFRMIYKLLFFKKAVSYHVRSLNYSFAMADSVLKTAAGKPRFFYMHINSPHGPLCTDSLGRPNYNYVTGSADYLNQLIFTQKSVIKLVTTILEQEKGQCIIVVQSDHGIRAHSTPVMMPDEKDMFSVVNAVYFPDSTQQRYFSDSMNIVNNFRMLFNYQFKTPLQKLQ